MVDKTDEQSRYDENAETQAVIDELRKKLTAIETVLPVIEADERYGGSDPNYRTGFREGKSFVVAQVRKAMRSL